jgi:hypothetical protein
MRFITVSDEISGTDDTGGRDEINGSDDPNDTAGAMLIKLGQDTLTSTSRFSKIPGIAY